MKPKGNTQSFEYDAANRLVKVTTPAGSSTLAYDMHGNLTGRTDALTHATVYAYDARHRRTRTTFADSKFETQTFDGVGNVKTLTDANLTVTTSTYDERNRESAPVFKVDETAGGVYLQLTQNIEDADASPSYQSLKAGVTRHLGAEVVTQY